MRSRQYENGYHVHFETSGFGIVMRQAGGFQNSISYHNKAAERPITFMKAGVRIRIRSDPYEFVGSAFHIKTMDPDSRCDL